MDIEIMANIAEYAAMQGLAFETAEIIARHNYLHVLQAIHRRAAK